MTQTERTIPDNLVHSVVTLSLNSTLQPLPRANPLLDHVDIVGHIIPFASGDGYLFVAGVSKLWQTAWEYNHGISRHTALTAVVQSTARLAWAKSSGCPWTLEVCNSAAASGHLEVLQWCRANGCPWGASTCATAADGGHLEMLKWCRANGCEWDTWSCRNAARNGHLDVLR